MFKTICLALDGSENSKSAIGVAAELAEAGGAKIVLAHVVELVAGKGGVVPVRIEDAIEAELEEQLEALRERGIEAELEITENILGGPARGVLEIAERVGADLIVCATRGHTALGGLLLGSVAARLVQLAERPVLVVPS